MLALTLGAAWMFVAMFRERLDAIEHMVTVATTIFVSRHGVLTSDSEHRGWLLLAPVGREQVRPKLACWSARVYRAGSLPNPLMQPTNAGNAVPRGRPALLAATKDRRLSQVVCS